MRTAGLLLLAATLAFAQEGWERLTPEQLVAKREDARQLRAGLGDPVPEDKQPLHRAATERIDLLDQLLRTLDDQNLLMTAADIQKRHRKATEALERLRNEGVGPASEAEAQRAVDLALAERKRLEESLAKLEERLAQARKALEEMPAREVAAKGRIAAAAEEGTGELARYRAANAELELYFVRRRTEFLQQATERWALRLGMEQAEVDLARAEVDAVQQRLNRIRGDVARDLAEASKRARAEAEAAAKEAVQESDPVARFRKQARADVLRLHADRKDFEALVKTLDRQLADEREWLRSLGEEKEALEKRFSVRGDLPGQGAALLRATLKRAKGARQVLVQHSLPDLYRDVARVNAATIDVLDRLFALQQPLGENGDYLAFVERAGEARAEEAARAFQEGRDALLPVLREHRTALEQVALRQSELEKLHLERLDTIDRVQTLVLSRIVWIRTDPPLDWNLATEIGGELKRLFNIFASTEMLGGIGRAVADGPLRLGGALLGVLLTLAICFFAMPRLRVLYRADTPAGIGVRALRIVAAVVLAAIPPAALVILGLLVAPLQLPDPLAGPAMRLLFVCAAFWFPRRLAIAILGSKGVGVRGGWVEPQLARQLLFSITLVTVGGMMFRAPATALALEPLSLVHLPRVLVTVHRAVVALAIILLIRRKGSLIHGWTGGSGAVFRIWGLVGPLLTLGLIGTIVMDVLGYREGSFFFLFGMLQSLMAVLLLAGLHSGLRKLVETIAAHVQRRTAHEEGAQAAQESSNAVLNQLTRLVLALVILLAVVLLASFWELDDALRVFLDGVGLAAIGGGVNLTLWNVFVALAWIAGGHFLVHNLSALYQFLFAGAADAGGKYVFFALTRYVVLLVVYSAALLELHFSFSSLGWLLAAASVGLGFGLQEIVANFVSGLILLFESPIRVGDIITVGDTGGVVDKINIRATVVTNWDRQQIIVPNKAFITQNLTNWTRNDNITRRKVQVGVAYGSDIERVLKILTEVVDRPGVRKDPPPRILFEAFGDSSLLFEAWFFCPVQDGKLLMSAVRTDIDRRFREEGITIAFPQLDLHLDDRTLDALRPPQP